MKRIFGLSFFTRCSNGDLTLASCHPRNSGTWHWSVCITGKQREFRGLVSRAPMRRGQWHDYFRLPFGYAICVSRQDYHLRGC